MRRVYIYDNHQLSLGNGIGTFLKDFARCVACWEEEIQLCMIMFCTRSEKFFIGRHGGIEYFFFPKELCEDPFEDCEPVMDILENHIVDARDNFFLINYTPSDKLMLATRKHFPLSRQVCVIHDFKWTAPLLGDVGLFRKLITEKEKDIPCQYKDMMELYRREIIRYSVADSVVCLSEDTRDLLEECYGVAEEKITLIPNGVDTIKKAASASIKQKWRANYYLGSDEFIILMVGRINKAKGMFAYLNAFKKVLKKNPDCRLVISSRLRLYSWCSR